MSKTSHRSVVRKRKVLPLEAMSSVDPHLIRPVDQNIGDTGELEQWLEGTCATRTTQQSIVDLQDIRVSERATG